MSVEFYSIMYNKFLHIVSIDRRIFKLFSLSLSLCLYMYILFFYILYAFNDVIGIDYASFVSEKSFCEHFNTVTNISFRISLLIDMQHERKKRSIFLESSQTMQLDNERLYCIFSIDKVKTTNGGIFCASFRYNGVSRYEKLEYPFPHMSICRNMLFIQSDAS